jgi:hypothetical protein
MSRFMRRMRRPGRKIWSMQRSTRSMSRLAGIIIIKGSAMAPKIAVAMKESQAHYPNCAWLTKPARVPLSYTVMMEILLGTR